MSKEAKKLLSKIMERSLPLRRARLVKGGKDLANLSKLVKKIMWNSNEQVSTRPRDEIVMTKKISSSSAPTIEARERERSLPPFYRHGSLI